MIRRRSFPPMQRPIAWTTGTLIVLCGSVLCSELVRSEEAPQPSSASAAVSRKSEADEAGATGMTSGSDLPAHVATTPAMPSWAGPRKTARQDATRHELSGDNTVLLPAAGPGQAAIANTTLAEKPTGWASLEGESTGSATIGDGPQWRSSESKLSPQQASAADVPRWAGMADETPGRVSTRDAKPGRVAVFDEQAVSVEVPRDAGRPAARIKSNAARDTQPAIVVMPNRNEATDTPPFRPGSTAPEGRDGLPVVSSRHNRTTTESSATAPPEVAEVFITDGTPDLPSETTPHASTPKPLRSSERDSAPAISVAATADSSNPACDSAACGDEKNLTGHTLTASSNSDDDVQSVPDMPGLSSATGKASVANHTDDPSSASTDGRETGDGLRLGNTPPVEGWRPHPTMKFVEIAPTAAAPGLEPVDVGGGNETLPRPPRPPDSALRLSGGTESLSQSGRTMRTLFDGPALAAPARVSAEPSAVSTLRSDDAGRRKGSDFATTRATSPRRIALFEADGPPAFEPPPTPGGTEPSEPGSGAPADLEPLLAPSTNSGDNPALDGPQLSGPGNARQKAASPEDQKLGEAPEDTSLRFLRQQTVLLKPGEMQFDVSLQYINDKIDFVGVQQVGGLTQIAEAERRQRLLMVPLQLRVGICDYTQAFVNVPFGWSNSESEFLGQDSATSTGGIGDVSAGFIKQVVVGNEFYPDVLTSMSFSAPTGESNFLTALTTPGSNLGEGFWSLTSSITFIQNYDPIVLFYGGGYRHRFQEKFNGTTKVTPGSQFIYRFGVGFAVNPNVTLSATFNGSFIGEYEVNGTNIGGSTQEPMQIRLAATINKRKVSKTHSSVKLVEPFVTFGLNDDAIDTIIGATWTF